ncbi:hypothetical protein PTTG_11403 [Puccinia triticina 1-1 BBBD Race 1]|uniref:Uncharacterized protein n=1 Tax=Puccinia triticina (isolate 1-1 / race 1 (BBBD)) TaxID=630390 RepID=A0A0C4FDU7_PUCT1|nr:hypothetical protein PTTG_11403 [Puccinia triticina 1-1 BBBD Race 1]WAR60805.1 hypothetical protein PtB15_13B50 [Puccinia triticina]
MSNPIAETSNQLKASTELAVDTTQHAPPNPTPSDSNQPDPNIPTIQAPAAPSAQAPKTNPQSGKDHSPQEYLTGHSQTTKETQKESKPKNRQDSR